jgi:hypothetical protein
MNGEVLHKERVNAGGLCPTAFIAGDRKTPLRVLSQKEARNQFGDIMPSDQEHG